MKTVFILTISLFLFSCSGYFNDDGNEMSGDQVNSLALADGSGYLSTDNYNEITPFVFRDTLTGKNWLFFSSDKAGGGNYDIYYAELYASGRFSNPVKLTSIINSTSNQFAPLVYRSFLVSRSPQINLMLTYVEVSPSGNNTNVVSWRLNSSFDTVDGIVDEVMGFHAKNIGYMLVSNDLVNGGLIIICDGNSNGFTFQKGNNNGWTFELGGSGTMRDLTNVLRSSVRLRGINGFLDITTSIYNYIIQSSNNQLLGTTIFAGTTNQFSIPAYASVYNDRDPFIDYGGTLWPVYFSSDRRGKGNYDLYRYNTKTFWAVTH